jgi:hypothetical protein
MIINGQGAPENSKDIFAPTLENINKDNGIMLVNKYKANIIIFLLNEIVGNRAKFSAEKFSKCRTFL